MKKLVLTIAIIIGLGLTTAFAQAKGYSGGLFQRGSEPKEFGNRELYQPMMPEHGWAFGDQNALHTEQTPLGSGIAVLLGLGAAYLVGKKRREE